MPFVHPRPGEVEVLRQVLDHATNETTTDDCIDFETMATVSLFDQIVLGRAKERPAWHCDAPIMVKALLVLSVERLPGDGDSQRSRGPRSA
jgi:hypothetical protein